MSLQLAADCRQMSPSQDTAFLHLPEKLRLPYLLIASALPLIFSHFVLVLIYLLFYKRQQHLLSRLGFQVVFHMFITVRRSPKS